MKTKLFYLLIIFFTFQTVASAQTKFVRNFWQILGERFNSTAVIELSSGEYVMAGTVKDSAVGSLTDVFLVKFNSVGDTVWTRRIAAPGSEGINDVHQTNDGGYILTGWTDSYGSIYGTVLLLKTDSLGNPSWAKVFSNNTTSGAEGFSVRQNADSGYIIAAKIFAPLNKSLFIRTNSSGDSLWTRIYDIGSDSRGYFAEETPTGEFILALEADTGQFLGQLLMISKVSSAGTPIWTRNVNGYGFSLDMYKIEQTIDGGYLFAGEYYGNGGELLIIKFDGNGNYIFGKNFIPTLSGYLENLSATQLADSTYRVVASFASVIQQTSLGLMLRLNQTGDTMYTRHLTGYYFNHGGSFTSDGGYVTVDPVGSIYKIDSSFNKECTPSVQGSCTVNNYVASNSLLHDSVGVIVVVNGTFTIGNNMPRRLYTPCTPNIPTCVVTVDSATQKNLVIWEENFDTTFIDSYQVYKESAAAGVYNLIGSVPHNQLSTFLDTTSNPAAQSDRYRVSALWHTSYEPPNTVAGHKTIHLSVSPGLPPTMNLSWSSYEGFTYSTYNVWRGNGITSSIIVSLPYGTNNYTDLNPPAGDSLYYVEVVHAPCNPTFRFGNGEGGNSDFSTYNGTISNRFNISMFFVGMNRVESVPGISLSPVPAENELLITSKAFSIRSVIISDALGQQLTAFNFEDVKNESVPIDVSELSPGVYTLQVFGSDSKSISKLFIKR